MVQFKDLKRMVVVLCLISATLWALGLAGIAQEVHTRGDFRLGNDFPEFQDILIYKTRFWLYHTAAFFQLRDGYSSFAYPPAAAPLYSAFYRSGHPDTTFLLILAAWTLFMAACIGNILRRFFTGRAAGIFISVASLLFSFPVVFLAERANLELFVWIVVICGLYLLTRGRPLLAAACFGLAASWKLYPLLLLGFFIGNRVNWRAIATGIAAGIGATVLSLWYSGPTLALATRGYLDGISRFKAANGEAPRFVELLFDHSFFSPIKLSGLYGHLHTQRWAPWYYVIAGLSITAVYLLRVRHQSDLNRFMFLSICMVTLPPVSYEYTLVHLYAPTVLLLRDSLARAREVESDVSPTLLLTLVCALLITLPFGLVGGGTFRFAGQIQVITLAVLLTLTATCPWHFRPLAPSAALPA